MLNMKKAFFLFATAVGLAGALGTAYAQPTRLECMKASIACTVDDNMDQCWVVSRFCGVYGIFV
ncbi:MULTISPECIES: hypothetical protein [unclassified Janthinobacterium]|uniref:hypothetical protein n=1 Tax=unclassified Janthinobacterium TaxID=2610881 RepID=UPI001615D02D|nr:MULTISPECIES: hypothetical protein [unclassified Janthinobacterium]MBB5371739.1 hypothetical protein [Janthinobacterium sp. K2C7]MBB5384544.1 hypothetical protein [Janthinobacterium sp. K2Li3]MBB5389820.1 hypothetical protein [Janthinobacterium sp. K2E3]